jgi:hypothetical protein
MIAILVYSNDNSCMITKRTIIFFLYIVDIIDNIITKTINVHIIDNIITKTKRRPLPT